MLFNPLVPSMERHLLLLAFLVEFTRWNLTLQVNNLNFAPESYLLQRQSRCLSRCRASLKLARSTQKEEGWGTSMAKVVSVVKKVTKVFNERIQIFSHYQSKVFLFRFLSLLLQSCIRATCIRTPQLSHHHVTGCQFVVFDFLVCAKIKSKDYLQSGTSALEKGVSLILSVLFSRASSS